MRLSVPLSLLKSFFYSFFSPGEALLHTDADLRNAFASLPLSTVRIILEGRAVPQVTLSQHIYHVVSRDYKLH